MYVAIDQCFTTREFASTRFT